MRGKTFLILSLILTSLLGESLNVRRVGYYNTPGLAYGVYVSGSYCYVADGNAGLRIINVSNPHNPYEVGYYNAPGVVVGVYVSGVLAYIANYAHGVRVINVSNPSNPFQVGHYDTPGLALGVYVSGPYAYVADYNTGLRILNITNPRNPYQVGYYITPSFAMGVYVSGPYAYVAAGSAGLRIINISNPSNPYEVGYYDTPGFAIGVYVSGFYAYVADSGAGLRIIDISNPSNPYQVGYYDTPGIARGVYVSGSYAYVADYNTGLRIINIFNPRNPYEVGYYDTPGYAYGVYVVGSYAFVADEGAGLQILQFYIDVGVTGIISPPVGGVVLRSDTLKPVSGKVKNFGNFPATFKSFFRIYRGDNLIYFDSLTKTVAGHAESVVNFTSYAWAQDTGEFKVVMRTVLDGDMNTGNDSIAGVFNVILLDVGVTGIISPPVGGVVLRSDTLKPVSGKVKNFGNFPATFKSFFRIYRGDNLIYFDSLTKTVAGHAESVVNFTSYAWAQDTGEFKVVMRTVLDGDMNTGNDSIAGVFNVILLDVGVTGIISPPVGGVVLRSDTLKPVSGKVKNFGNFPATFKSFFRIYRGDNLIYFDSLTKTVAGHAESVVNFTSYAWAQDTGEFKVVMRTVLDGDMNTGNDSIAGVFNVILLDVGVTGIISPPVGGVVLRSDTLKPVSGKVKNFGNFPATFKSFFRIYRGDNLIYFDSLTKTVAGHAESVVNFTSYAWAQDTGEFKVVMRTVLDGDMNTGNDSIAGVFNVILLDVGVTGIISPPVGGVVLRSDTLKPVSGKVKNFGNFPATFKSFFRIYRGDNLIYFDSLTKTVAGHAESVVNFTSYAWAQDTGEFKVVMRTVLDGDMNTGNDSIAGVFNVILLDVGVTGIISPPVGGVVLRSDTLKPVSGKVKNFGNFPATFKSFFRIYRGDNLIYFDSLTKTVAGHAESVVNFTSYAWAQDTGEFKVVMRTVLDGDMNTGNDSIAGVFNVILLDVGVTGIISPPVGGVVLRSDTLKPVSGKVKNFGNFPATFKSFFRIYRGDNLIYFDSLTKTVAGHAESVVNFTSYAWAQDTGEFKVVMRTVLDGDMNTGNDSIAGVFNVILLDVGVTGIISPPVGGVVLRSDTLKPVSGKVKNFGNFPATFKSFFRIYRGDNLIYFDSLTKTVAGHAESVVNFTSYAWAQDTGEFKVVMRTVLDGDMNTGNDSIAGVFNVISTVLSPGWYKKADVTGAKKPVKSGGALVAVGDKVYALVGNNTRDLMVYDIGADTWTKKSEVPISVTGKKKNVKKGAAICADHRGWIYVIKGGNTKEFWRYKPEKDSWKEFTVPFEKGIKGGSMTFDGSRYIYLISGSNNNQWIRFDVIRDTFEACNPATLPADKWKTGSWIVYTPGDMIYGLRVGGKTNEFYKIPIGGTAEKKTDMPMIGSTGKKKKAKEGSAGAYNPTDKKIYALKGGNTLEFFSFNTATDSWKILEDVGQPAGTPAKRVKGGGALTYSGAAGGLFAFVGSGTNEFWFYMPGGGTFLASAKPSGSAIQAETKNLKNFTLQVIPTKDYLKVSYTLPINIKASLKIYNALGELVYTATSDRGYFVIDKKKFACGIYIMKFNANEYKATKKLVIH
ncbi:MAG: T9SS type A sorting domain-containing protein [candidate division WOR-3 bacterium]|nr:T9SS type A sorting domain-containing protein [candidate division WOR-3 bacterium]